MQRAGFRRQAGGCFEAPASQAGKDWAGHGGRGNADDKAPDEDHARVGVQGVDGHDRAGMRRHQAVHGGETGQQRKGQLQEGPPRLAGRV